MNNIYEITYDLGNLSEWLSAIGTILAVFISLYLIYDERRTKFNLIPFIQDKVVSEMTSDKKGIIRNARIITFYGLNNGIRPIPVMFNGIRVKKHFLCEKNSLVKLPIGDTTLASNDFEVIHPGYKSKTYTVDFDDLEKALLDQMPERKKI